MLRLVPTVIIALANLVAACAQEKPAETKLPDVEVEVPLKFVNGQPGLEVRINGQGPYLLLFDTGAAGCGRIDAELSEKLKLREAGKVQMGDPSGRNMRTGMRVRADELRIGDALFRDLVMVQRDARDPVDLSRSGIQGIVGIGTFADALVTLDYPGRKLRIARGELPSPDQREIFAYESEHGIPNVVLKIGSAELRADVDSGSMGALTVPGKFAKKLELAGEPVVTGRARTSFNEFDVKEARMKGDFRLGRHVFDSPVVAFNDIFPRGNLGGGILRHFAITIDQKNQRIRFAREGNDPIRTEPRYRIGVMFEPAEGALRVRDVMPGGAGAAAGLKTGDRIVRVNGKPVADLQDEELRSIFSRPESVRLTIERAGTTTEAELTPKSTE